MTSRSISPWECLKLLLDQGQFELADSEAFLSGKCSDCKVIYLMNDTVESFLVFKNARYTGSYIDGYEDEITYTLEKEERFLRVNQETGHFLLFFDELERQIATLKNFPPLNYTCFPSADLKYIVPLGHPWEPASDAINFFSSLCLEAGDRKLVNVLETYRKHPTRRMSKKIAHMLTLSHHSSVPELLYRQILKAASDYPARVFGGEVDAKRASKLKKAREIAKKYNNNSVQARIYVEDPFIHDCDDITLHVHVMTLKKTIYRRKIQVTEV